MTVRPTAVERAAWIRDMLTRVIAPALPGGYPSDVLGLCIHSLSALADDGDLLREIAEIEAVLEAAGLSAVEAGIPVMEGHRDIERRAIAARARLSAAVRLHCFKPGSGELDRLFGAYFRRTAERLPEAYRKPR